MHNHSYENEFNLHVNEISFLYERIGTKTRFKTEAKGNSETSYCLANSSLANSTALILLYFWFTTRPMLDQC